MPPRALAVDANLGVPFGRAPVGGLEVALLSPCLWPPTCLLDPVDSGFRVAGLLAAAGIRGLSLPGGAVGGWYPPSTRPVDLPRVVWPFLPILPVFSRAPVWIGIFLLAW